MATRPPADDRAFTDDLLRRLTEDHHVPNRLELARLRQYFAMQVLPAQPTSRVLVKHGKHVEDDLQWPDDIDAYVDRQQGFWVQQT